MKNLFWTINLCTLLALVMLQRFIVYGSLHLTKEQLSKYLSQNDSTPVSTQWNKPFHRNKGQFGTKASWVLPLPFVLLNSTPDGFKKISKRSGAHLPYTPNVGEKFNGSLNSKLLDFNSTQKELGRNYTSGLEPFIVDKSPSVKEKEHFKVRIATTTNQPNPEESKKDTARKGNLFREISLGAMAAPIKEPTLEEYLEPEMLFDTKTLPPFNRPPSLLDIDYDDDKGFWFIIDQTSRDRCGTRCEPLESASHGRETELCPKCWCDTACRVFGDCCLNFYMENGYTPPMDSSVQGCRRVQYPDVGINYYRLIRSCADSKTIVNLERYPKIQKAQRNISSTPSHSLPKTTAEEMMEAERLCLTPDPAAHWNQTRPVTDRVSGLTFANQYCAVCSGVSLEAFTPWAISVVTTSNTLFTASFSVLDIYRTAMTSDDADVVYKPPLPANDAESTVRECKNYNDVSTTDMHLTRCNQTGLWRHFSRAAARACEMFNLPIYPLPKVYSYQNVYCYYCNHDVPWEKVMQLRETSPHTIHGKPDDNVLSVLLDLDGSDERKYLTHDPEENGNFMSVTNKSCSNSSQFYDLKEDTCRDLKCVPGKIPTENHTCISNPDFHSGVLGYMACYLVTGIPGGSNIVSDLASSLEQEPDLVNSFGVNSTTGEADNFHELDYENEVSKAFRATVVKTTRWGCNSCGLLGHHADTASLLIQVAWASQSVLDRDETEQNLEQAKTPLIKLLDLTVSAQPGSALYIGNLTVVKYPYCSIELNPAPSTRFQTRPPPVYKEQFMAPVPCMDKKGVANQSTCAIDLEPRVTIPQYLYTRTGELMNYVNGVQYLPINSLLNCQYVEISKKEYTFNIQDWTIRLKHCETEFPASDVTISEADGTMFVCLKDYVCWARSQNTANDFHDIALRWISLICTLLSMACCLLAFLTYSCLPQLRSSAGINNMVLAFLVFFAQGLAQFGSSQRDRHDICSAIGVLTHFFWLAAVTSMSTATFHMFYALTFPLRFQQYQGRERVLLRVYIALVLLIPSLLISSTMLNAQILEGNFGYSSGRNCFINTGTPKIMFFGVPVLLLIMLNIGMYTFTVARLHGKPNIGETKIRRSNVKLYSKLSVVTGASWIFGFLYEWTEFVPFAYAYMLTAPLLGLFLLLAFVANKRVMDMARAKMPEGLTQMMVTRGESSVSRSTSEKTKTTSLA